MARNGITGETAERIITSITSFALYGFPESHAASFALLAYASAYLKVHYPAAFYTALLNNQPMGFYHPATLVKDAQRRGVRFHPIDVQQSDWLCRVEDDGAIRIGFMYVTRPAKGRGAGDGGIRSNEDAGTSGALREMRIRRRVDDRGGARHAASAPADRTTSATSARTNGRCSSVRSGGFRSIEDVVQRRVCVATS